MSDAFSDLIRSLTAEAEVFESLIVLGRAERDLLVAGDVPALSENLARQRALLTDLADIEGKRRSALDEWTERDDKEGGVDGPAPTLREVIPLAPPPAAAALASLHKRLTRSAEELRRLARGNYFLALKGLEFVDATVRLIAGQQDSSQAATYAAPGGSSPKGRGALIVDRTV